MQIKSAAASVYNQPARQASHGSGQTTAQPQGTPAKPDAVEAFLAEARKSPAQRLREQWLERHNLTEESLAALSPERRDAINAEIAEEIKRALTGVQPRRGVSFDVTL